MCTYRCKPDRNPQRFRGVIIRRLLLTMVQRLGDDERVRPDSSQLKTSSKADAYVIFIVILLAMD